MRSQAVKQGSLGLVILAGIGVTAGFALWLRGVSFGSNAFSFVIKLEDSSGLDVGSPVRYRGAVVGKVQKLEPEPDAVKVIVAIDNPNLAIPRQAAIETNQTGFLSNASIDIIPSLGTKIAGGLSPTQPDCPATQIICQGDTVEGKPGVSFTQLMRETRAAIRQITDQELVNNLNRTLKAAGSAATSVQKLSDNANQVVQNFANPLEKSLEKFGNTADAVSAAANNFGKVADSAQGFIDQGKGQVGETLKGVNSAAAEAKSLLASAKPLLADGKFIGNLQKLSENVAQASENLRLLSVEVNNPNTLVALREALDSARATFANTKKITADLDELTGDPKFRSNLRNLVNGLNSLVSTNSGQPIVFSFAAPDLLAEQAPAR
ncbi:MAG: MlaD family protein [Pseudanabaenaceae cyanobacterium bins.68]|nr:MlaD family protein [Pseudanabaenaceae cyanobacterium bins.68]